MTAAQYQAEFDKQNRAGFYPICVQGGGSGAGTRYAAVFAKQDIPVRGSGRRPAPRSRSSRASTT